MNELLSDTTLVEKLKEDGFVSIPFFSTSELEKAREIYFNFHPNHQIPNLIDGIHMTSWCSDHEYKLNVANNIKSLTALKSKTLFDNYRSLNHVFIIKIKGENTTFPVHQDWNVVDETKYRSVNIWIPLWDVDENNGALWVVNGSHKINRPIRGAGCLFPDYSEYRELLKTKATSVNIKAGSAVIFYHNTIHGSPPNRGSHPRVVIAFSAIPEKAPLHIYFQKDFNSMLEVHQPKDDFMYSYDNLREETQFKGPTDKPIEMRLPYKNKKLTIEELELLIANSK